MQIILLVTEVSTYTSTRAIVDIHNCSEKFPFGEYFGAIWIRCFP